MYRHPTTILRIVFDTYSETSYTDTDCEDDVIPVGAGELGREFICVGDTMGKEAGSQTGVTAHFNPVTGIDNLTVLIA